MNSLEFIEKEIRELKFQINYIESNMKRYIDFRTEGQLEVDIRQLKLNHLQQIKSELEAWEVVKKFIFDSNGVYLLRLDSDDDYDNEYYQILKKALEVE